MVRIRRVDRTRQATLPMPSCAGMEGPTLYWLGKVQSRTIQAGRTYPLPDLRRTKGGVTMTQSELHSLTGGLSRPSKMPCHGYSIPASTCKTGSKLRAVSGSTCSSCYACKGRYTFDNVQSALHRRLESIEKPEWVEWMVDLIGRREKSGFFRWHDSGDLQSMAHLLAIVEF